MRPRAAAAILLFVVACDAAPAPIGPTSSTSTTTTTIDDDTCERVAGDTAEYLEAVIDRLDATQLRDLVDEEMWPQELRDLQRAGRDLDLRVGALRCDPVAIQRFVFAEADVAPRGPLSAILVDILLSPDITAPQPGADG